MLALLSTVTGLGLSVSLRFPEVLLDPPSFGASLASARPVAAVASLLGLAASGVVLVRLSRGLPAARLFGVVAGWCLAACGAAGLALLVLWGSGLDAAASVVSTSVFAVFGLAVPLLLAVWTARLVRSVGVGAITGWLAVAGLVATVVRSATWWLNAILPTQDGFYVVSAILTLLALTAAPLWIFWLIRLGFSLRSSSPVAAPGRGFAAVARRCGLGLLTLVFALAHATAAIVSTPIPDTSDVPAVPSAGAAFFHPVMLAAASQFAQPTSYPDLLEQRRDERFTEPRTPAGTTIDKVDAGDVPAEFLCADGATKDRVFLYLHGGGFIMPMSNFHRDFAAELSRQTGSCLLMPHYRLAPKHPFPAAIEDSVAAYRWLLETGVPAAAVTIIGDSCGGTFTLSTALSLQDSGDEMPGALVGLSPATDLTFTGETHRSNAWTDPLIAAEHKKFVQRSYTGDGEADVRDPLLSPLFADTVDLATLPPTLLHAGSEETLLSDSIRMADRMRMAGGDVALEVWPGLPHTVPLVFPEIMEADVTFERIADFSAVHTS